MSQVPRLLFRSVSKVALYRSDVHRLSRYATHRLAVQGDVLLTMHERTLFLLVCLLIEVRPMRGCVYQVLCMYIYNHIYGISAA